MRIDLAAGRVVWRHPPRAAWLGLARSGREWRDTVWASGGGTNRVYRLIWLGGAGWTSDSAARPHTRARLFAAGLALVPSRGLVAVVGPLSDSVYLIDAATLTRRGAVAVGHTPYTVVADSSHLYVSDWGDSTVSVIDVSITPRCAGPPSSSARIRPPWRCAGVSCSSPWRARTASRASISHAARWSSSSRSPSIPTRRSGAIPTRWRSRPTAGRCTSRWRGTTRSRGAPSPRSACAWQG